MSGGGMIQTQRRDGTWKDAFPTSGYKSHAAALAVASSTHRPVRIINRAGRIMFEVSETTREDTQK